MKRLILSLFVVLLGATSAMGQGYTADWVVKSSNELLYKVSERGNVIRMELPKKDGGVMPMLMFGKDSLCLLMPETKSYAVFTGEKMRHPVQKYNHVDARMEVMTGVRFTPMSAENFIVPKGWSRTSMDAMMDVINGLMKSSMEGDADALNKLGDFMKEAKSARDGKGNTGNQAKDLNSLLEMMGGAKKK